MNISVLGVAVIASLSSVATVIPTPTSPSTTHPVLKTEASPTDAPMDAPESIDTPEVEAIAPQNPASEAIVEVSHYNGATLTLNGEELPWGQEATPLEVGDTIAIGSGYSEFGVQVPDDSSLVWKVDIFPGDSLASVELGDYYLSVEEPTSEIVTLSSVRGYIIAYGYSPDQPTPVVLTLLDEEPKTPTEAPQVPE
ncbi:MAG: hypothetical protein VKL39_03035 [Leptolyngbyaceae bacterium]|nr:hypothetical protein [Leptolyngbyaceae bacterium]